MNKEDLKIRFVPDCIQIREAQVDGEESRVIEGRAIPFNAETVLMRDGKGTLSEVIKPEACSQEWIDTQDIVLNIYHEDTEIVARCNKGVGNMSVQSRADGVWFQATMPKCDKGAQALEYVKCGILSGCSCEFMIGEYDIEDRSEAKDGSDLLVTHTQFKMLHALTLTPNPAYKQTSVCTRDEWEELSDAEKELLEREKQEREARHQLAMRSLWMMKQRMTMMD